MAGPSLIATLGANITQFVRDLQTAKGHAKTEGAGIGSALGNEISGRLAQLATVAGVEQVIQRTVQWGSHINDLAFRLGMSRMEVQEWDYALKQNGSSLQEQIPFFEKLGVARAKALQGSEKDIELFRKFGITLDDLRSKGKGGLAEQALTAYAADPENMSAALRELGGKGAGGMVAAFRDGFSDILKEFREANLGVADKIIAELDKADDAFTKFATKFRALNAPAIAGLLKLVNDLGGVASKTGTEGFLAKLLTGPAGQVKEVLALYAQMGAAPPKTETKPGAIPNDEDDKAKKSREKIAEDDEKLEARRGKQAADEINKVKKIHEDIAEIQRKSSMQGMSADEKRAMLAREIARLQAEHERDVGIGGLTDVELAEQEKEIAQREAEMAGIKGDTFKRTPFEVNQAQRIGAFMGSMADTSTLATLDIARKSEGHLAAIRKGIEKLSVGGGEDDTQF